MKDLWHALLLTVLVITQASCLIIPTPEWGEALYSAEQLEHFDSMLFDTDKAKRETLQGWLSEIEAQEAE